MGVKMEFLLDSLFTFATSFEKKNCWRGSKKSKVAGCPQSHGNHGNHGKLSKQSGKVMGLFSILKSHGKFMGFS